MDSLDALWIVCGFGFRRVLGCVFVYRVFYLVRVVWMMCDCEVFVDTHAHLQWKSFDGDREYVLVRAREKGVVRIVNIGFDVAGSVKGVELAEKHEGLFATVGIHPHNASTLNEETVDTLRELSTNPQVVGIGEIGLDYYRNLAPKNVQRKAFEVQLALAEELKLPVIIHDREAHDDVLQTLLGFKGKVKGVMHCFSGSKELAQRCIDLGFFISFAGNVTYPKACGLQEIAEWIDLKKMLLETDCPFLAPQEMRGKRNEPSFLPLLAEKVANLKRMSLDDLAEITTRNAEEILKLY
jgi:TatD DNase family protein